MSRQAALVAGSRDAIAGFMVKKRESGRGRHNINHCSGGRLLFFPTSAVSRTTN